MRQGRDHGRWCRALHVSGVATCVSPTHVATEAQRRRTHAWGAAPPPTAAPHRDTLTRRCRGRTREAGADTAQHDAREQVQRRTVRHTPADAPTDTACCGARRADCLALAAHDDARHVVVVAAAVAAPHHLQAALQRHHVHRVSRNGHRPLCWCARLAVATPAHFFARRSVCMCARYERRDSGSRSRDGVRTAAAGALAS
jgi:hypothetical protein